MQKNFAVLSLFILLFLSGCACDFLGMENVVGSKTPFEKRIEEEKKSNNYNVGGDSDNGTAGHLKTVYFDYKKTTLNPEQIEILNNNIRELIRNPNVSFLIAAHTDNVGGLKYNKTLSQKRAEYLSSYLISKGIPNARFSIKIFGATDPLITDESDKIKSYDQILQYKNSFNKNRRINFIINSI